MVRNKASLWFPFGSLALSHPASASDPDSAHHESRSEYRAPVASVAPVIDGVADESIWGQARWHELKYRWVGHEYSPDVGGQRTLKELTLSTVDSTAQFGHTGGICQPAVTFGSHT